MTDIVRNAVPTSFAAGDVLKTFDTMRVFRPRDLRFDEVALVREPRLPPILTQPQIFWGLPGIPREKVSQPIAPGDPPSDTMVFTGPADDAAASWLPRWRLRRTQSRYDIELKDAGDGIWLFAFGLEPVAAPEVAAVAAGGAPVLANTLRAEIHFQYDASTVVRAFPVDELAPDARGQVARLRLALEDRDALLRAFRSDAAAGALIVTRHITVAIARAFDPRRDGRALDRFRFPIDRGVLAAAIERAPVGVHPALAAEATRLAIDPNLLSRRGIGLRRVASPMMLRTSHIFLPPDDPGRENPTEVPYEPPATPTTPEDLSLIHI